MRLIDADKVVRYTCTIDRDHDYDVYDIEHAPTVEAIPVEFIEKYAQLSDDAVALFGVPVGVLKNVYRSLIDEWKKENEETI